ncbi:MAG TPA: preprotein translocase subunit Sec61beta [Candidatus Diapherotrites archaeon]|uniref:Preprotein translocase subunit Sec61beta n=1 Tax=Candidatus Iainarchaeum sp. TaxID=3101447 RepID=A0A7J4JGR6_9ARCH|nr:preprotein translocase subunit Sec61beta [Candidatus Diapherotrites archaeon]HIH16330.1 preprotein translocase subunit Sec61beta [Candidatus Diapherotrites archaeon]
MKFQRTSGGVSAPSSSIGIMRFFDADTAGPKLTPEFVVLFAGAFSAIVLAIHLVAG